MPLEEYRRKRDFRRTPEPSGGKAGRAPGKRLLFVVQRHAARRMHFDFRLEVAGVLKSWAVPKGPSFDPAERRLAVETEDHPMAYGGFEGVIPAGEYSAGTVQLWDRGTWEPEGDPLAGWRKGHLRFRLHGRKLHGRWSLVRTGKSDSDTGNWLLIKGNDDYAGFTLGKDERETSVASGRTLAQIAASPEQTWDPKRGAESTALGRGRPAASPGEISPQLASATEKAPEGDGWLHEIKFDGYRILGRVHRGKARLVSRNGKDWTPKFRALAEALEGLPLEEAWLDGEVTALLADGRSSFQALQEALSEGRDGDLVYFLFDLLYLDGHDLRDEPLLARKEALTHLLEAADGAAALRYSDHLQGHGDTFHRHACAMGLEGTLAKRADGRHRAGRGREWLKVKCQQRQEFVVGGYTEPAGARHGFGALLLGLYDDQGNLRYTGRVGTGFGHEMLERLHRRLQALEQHDSPFDVAAPPPARGLHWVRPELIAEVRFTEWTRDGVLRMPAFLGLREDKRPRDVHDERSVAADAREPAPAHIAGPRLSNPDKLLYPEAGLTKRDLALYCQAVAERMLPHLAGRPLTLVRCPDGYRSPCFFQKHAGSGLPRQLGQVAIDEKGRQAHYLYVETLDGVIALVQMGVLEIHTWGARCDRPDRPDRLVFDIDPDEGLPWAKVIEAAHRVRALLSELGLRAFARTTGGKGLHVVVPIERRHSWGEAKSFARAVAGHIAHESPREYTISPAKSARTGKVYLDYLRNGRGATAIASYSTRARAGAPVAVNLSWEEVTGELRPAAFTVETVPGRLARLSTDPWEEMHGLRQRITAAALRRLDVR